MQTKIFQTTVGGKTISAEFSDLAGQANGSVMLKCGDTAILATAVMSRKESTAPYFPLSVEFEEKFYAAGAILGSRFIRREGRPSDEAVLSARIIDRTIRPLFDSRLRNEIQVVISVLALGEEDPDVLGVIGASLALAVSDIPWAGPVGAVRIGQHSDTKQIIINPTYREREEGNLLFEVLACGKDNKINMIETVASEVSEADVVAVLEASTHIHHALVEFQTDIVATLGKQKQKITLQETPVEVQEFFTNNFSDTLQSTLFSNQTGKRHLHECKEEFIAALVAADITCSTPIVDRFFEDQIDQALHTGALTEHKRADGRSLTQIRPLFAKAGGVSLALHGSGIFYRGETHIFTALTLAGPGAAQVIDTIESPEMKKRYMHHYNFPPFSVGETGRVGGFNRRMIGHGALAEKALLAVLPTQTEFPYTIRLVSETFSSNGSSSMGSVCASTIALLDGGVPLVRPVAGIASGVMIDGDDYVLLTDIQGPEDEHGDMDFKVAGTSVGITAMQMDVKVDGIPLSILTEALADAKRARLAILETMQAEIAKPREHLSPRAPEIVSLVIEPEQIGLVIGGGGKTINKIKDETGVDDITVEDSGAIYITGASGRATRAAEHIRALTKIYIVGERHEVVITKVVEFGAFAKLDAHHEGLIHISEIAPFRIPAAADVLFEGQVVPVVVTKVDQGKIALSIRQADATLFQSHQPQ